MNPVSAIGNIVKSLAPLALSVMPGGALINAGLGLVSAATQGQDGAQSAMTGAAASGSKDASLDIEF